MNLRKETRNQHEKRGRSITRKPVRTKKNSNKKELPLKINTKLTINANSKENMNATSSSDNREQEQQPVVTKKVKSMFDPVQKTTVDFYEHMTSIKIHSADALSPNLYLRHPLVRVSLIDLRTGKLLVKSKIDRKITFSNENKDLHVILPCLTQVSFF